MTDIPASPYDDTVPPPDAVPTADPDGVPASPFEDDAAIAHEPAQED